MTIADYARLGGVEGAEVIMWMIMRGAMPAKIKCLHRSDLPTVTGIATAIYEAEPSEVDADTTSAYLAHVNHQLKGAETLEGIHPFTLERSHKGYRINKYLHALVDPDHRQKFKDNEEASLAAADLTDHERDMIRRRDWRAMIQYGVIFFMMGVAAVVGSSNYQCLCRDARGILRGLHEDA